MANEDKLLSQLSQAVSTEDSTRVLALLTDHPNLLNVGWDDPLHREWNGVPWKDVLSRWYEALSREDSMKVMALLADHPGLLNVGWGVEASKFEWKNKPWAPRTALHVGVRRGNARLVEQVLILCEVDIPRHSTTDQQDRGNSPSISSGEPDEAEITETQKNDIDIASGSRDETWWEPDRQQAEWIRLACAFVQEHPQDKKDTFLGRFLMAMDGEYRLDVVAMGAIQGNRENFHMLLFAMGICKLYDRLHPVGKCKLYDIELDVLPNLLLTNESKEDSDHRAQLREATEKVVQSLPEVGSRFAPSMEEYKRAYKEHLDFNFLPWQEYFFHFLMADRFSPSKRTARELWLAVKSISGSTWRFLSDLHDGQGRTPWHVGGFSYTSLAANFEEDEEAVKSIISSHDGTGRTPFQRSLASGDAGKCHNILLCSDFPSVQDDMKLSPLLHAQWHHSIYDILPIGLNKSTFPGSLEYTSPVVDEVSATNGFSRHAVSSTSGHFVPTIDSVPTPATRQCSHLGTAIIHKEAGRLQEATEECFRLQGATEECLGSPARSESGETSKLWLSLQQSKPWRFLHKQASALWQAVNSESKTELALQAELTPWESWRLDHWFPYRWKEGQWTGPRYGGPIVPKCLWSHVEPLFGSSERTYSFRWRWQEGGFDVELDGVELAALAGDPGSIASLPLGNYFTDSVERDRHKQPWPALHIAANTANYEVLKLLLRQPGCAPYVNDWQGNTALHHALNVVTIGKFQLHLLDHVDCQQVKSNYLKKEGQEFSHENDLAQRKGCINLILQAGCDIFKTNNQGEPPFPQGKLFKNSEFLSWWYDRQAKELEMTQRTLSSAANAISVTATLVATASYVGPLQPPLGYAGDPTQIQDTNLWVKIFIFCDTMSFYLAIVSITLSLVPNLPMQEQKMTEEVGRTRWMVAISVIALFPSIIFVLLAFVSSSIAVVSANAASTGGSLAISSASLGGLLCFMTFTIFFARLLAFVFPRNKLVRTIYKATNWSSN